MRKVLQTILIPALCMLPALSFAQNGKVRLSNESKLSINGKSNVNDFRCESEHELQQDSLDFDYHFSADTITVDGVSLFLEISEFDCGKKAINRDFRSTLKYKEHPFIQITLNELILENEENPVPKAANVTITIAGVERNYEVPLNAFSSSEEGVLVGGNKTLYMTDFGLTPPSPLFGLVQVSDELDIVFDLIVRFEP
ncbi:YceI family protein [Gracilimonas sediminicola]|uniref:YceI family protein n=1 Tax=Gracilimonas sediminicola TaxID=2952158 RepID=A0A9X2RBF1_9BACT|nr:YceI family protein [Gracilimonas sediminicola]MCP9290246.1 YceI family protein [Gracilimonas sediminicola]